MLDSEHPGDRPTEADSALIAEADHLLRRTSGVPVVAILPFGSRAEGRARPDSPVDPVVVVPDAADPHPAIRALYRALRPLRQQENLAIDLLIRSKSSADRSRERLNPPVQRGFSMTAESFEARR